MCARSEEGDGVRQQEVIPAKISRMLRRFGRSRSSAAGMPEKMKVDHTVTSREVDSTDTVTAFNECAWRARTGRGATLANPS